MNNKKKKIKKPSKKKLEETLEKKVKASDDYFKAQRKAALTWNLIFFIVIIAVTVAISIFSMSDINLNELFDLDSQQELEIALVLVTTLISFGIGSFSSYIKSKALDGKNKFNLKAFLMKSYMERIEKSELNPKIEHQYE